MILKTDIVTALERRYDYYSARNILKEAQTGSSVGDKEGYSPAELTALTGSLKELGDRLEEVIAELDGLSGGGAAPAKAEPKAAKKAEPKAEPKAAKKAEPKAEPKAAKKAEPKAAKADKKADKKKPAKKKKK